MHDGGANMSKNIPNRGTECWVFCNYIVFADNRFAARRIYEAIADHRDGRVMFGSITLDDGTNGYWIMMQGRGVADLSGAATNSLH